MGNMQIYMDSIIFRLQIAGGISLYWYELLKGFSTKGCDLHVVQRKGGENNIYHDQMVGLGEKVTENNPLPLSIARFLPCFEKIPDGSIFHSSYFRRSLKRNVANVVTVYDFTYEKFLHEIKRRPHILQKKRALQNADGIICISESTRRDMFELYADLEEKKVSVIHLGVSPVFQRLSTMEGKSGDDDFLAKPYVIFIGSRASYKNFHIAVDVIAERKDLHLLLVGGGPLTTEERNLLTNKVSGRFNHQQKVDDRQLNILYNRAFCLLYPSSYEGFGLPLLEAMQAGCPVVSVNSSSIPEVCDSAALLAQSIDTDSLGRDVDRLRDREYRQQLIESGLNRATLFSWDSCVDKTLQFYTELLESRG